jgi:hypothetical protein
MSRSVVALDALLDGAASRSRAAGVALLVQALARRLARPVDRDHALALAARLDLAAVGPDASPAARLVETLARLHEQLALNRRDPRGWSAAQRARLFDPDWLVRRCVGEPLLAAAAHRAWRDGAARLREAGVDVAALAWSVLMGAVLPAARLPARAAARGGAPQRRRMMTSDASGSGTVPGTAPGPN